MMYDNVADFIKQIRSIDSSGIDNYSVLEIAEYLHNNYINNDINIDIVSLVNELNIGVFMHSFSEEEYNAYSSLNINNKLLKKYGTDKVIFLNKFSKYEEQRFSIAHEFAYYLFDSKCKTDDVYQHLFTSDFELSDLNKKAYNFASEILIPQNEIKKFLNEYSNNYYLIRTLSKMYEVPTREIERAVSVLKNNNERNYRERKLIYK